jgi:acetylornithine deacetylase
LTSSPRETLDLRSLEWITRLVSLDTTSRNSNLELIDLVAAEMRRHGLSPQILPNEDGTKANLLLTIAAADGSTDGGVVLSGHTDVVPVDGQDWHTEPFAAQIRDGRLYGRGTADMKSFIGVLVSSLPRLAAARLTEPVHLALSYDEEVGCGGGAQLVKDMTSQGVHPTTCIVGEPTSMRVIAAHKSINLFDITVRGLAAHSSLTPQGVNAIEYASRIVVFVRSLGDEFKQHGPYDEAYVVPFTTASVNMIAGGIAGNTVADLCTVQMEFRSIAAVDAHEVLGRIRAYCDELQEEMRREHPGTGIELTPLAMVPGLDTAGSSPAIALGAVLGGTPSTDKVTYGTEAGLFQAAGIETVVCGPGDIQQAHSPNEFIELDQIRACEALVDRLVQHLTVAETNGTTP